MAEVQQAKPAQSQAAAGKGKDAEKEKGKERKLPSGTAELRKELAVMRRDQALQRLDSPARLKELRRALARALTKERSAVSTKEASRG